MARKHNKTKSKRRSTTKSKAKRNGAKPLLAKVASVRTAKPSASTSARPTSSMSAQPSIGMSTAQNGKLPTSPFNPAMTVIAMMGRVMSAYAELPARLSRCRHPLDVWFEQARFVQRVFSESTAPADRPSRA
jgi:hypothetical protein